MTKTAFENPSGEFFKLSEGQIEKGIAASRQSSRRRIILPIHRIQEAKVQRMVNFLQPGTYIRPHKHTMPHASESIVLLKGSIRFFTFDDDGNPRTSHILDANPLPGIIDIEPGTWHSFLVLQPDTVIFECKKGPYDAKTDKEFADWAPEEGDENAAKFMEGLAG